MPSPFPTFSCDILRWYPRSPRPAQKPALRPEDAAAVAAAARLKRPAERVNLAAYAMQEWSEWSTTAFTPMAAAACKEGKEWAGGRWWRQFGDAWPLLQPLGRLLDQPANIAAAEKAWACYSRVDAKKRALGDDTSSHLARIVFNKRNSSSSIAVHQFWQVRDVCDSDVDEDADDDA